MGGFGQMENHVKKLTGQFEMGDTVRNKMGGQPEIEGWRDKVKALIRNVVALIEMEGHMVKRRNYLELEGPRV